MFPDTYSFPKEYPAEKVVALLVDAFNENALDVVAAMEDFLL